MKKIFFKTLTASEKDAIIKNAVEIEIILDSSDFDFIANEFELNPVDDAEDDIILQQPRYVDLPLKEALEVTSDIQDDWYRFICKIYNLYPTTAKITYRLDRANNEIIATIKFR